MRVALLAAGVDCIYFVFFLVVGSPWLAWINVVSVAMYGLAYYLIYRRKLAWGALVIWLEAFTHAVIGTLLAGWDSSFHYLLLMFIPAVILVNSRRKGWAFVTAFVVFLGALDSLSRYLGPLAPLSAPALIVLKWLNITIFVTMFSALADYYRQKISQAEASLHAQATEDALTGLFNRRYFQQVAERELLRCRRSGSSAALLIMDIDLFKNINDSYGHDAGDQVLAAVGEHLRKASRGIDTLARWGGEEFVLLMPDASLEAARQAAERLRLEIAGLTIKTAAGEDIRCTLSLGVAVIRPEETLNEVLVRADWALYRSKTEGRNRVSVR